MTHTSGRTGRRITKRTIVHRTETNPTRLKTTTVARRSTRSRGDNGRDHFAVTAQIDDKGRVRLPKKIQDAIAVAPGDSVFFNVEWLSSETPTLRVAKAINPLASILDALAEEAEREHQAGQTVRFRDLIAEYRADVESGIDGDDVD